MGAWKDVPANTPVQRIVSGLQQYSALGYDKVCWLSQTCQLILPLLCIGGRGATGRRNSKPWSATPEHTRGHRFLPPRDSPPRPSRRLIQALAASPLSTALSLPSTANPAAVVAQRGQRPSRMDSRSR